jgi:hypothetical protein
MSSRSSQSRGNRCDKTSWFSNFAFISCTLIAQVMLTLRSALRFFQWSQTQRYGCCHRVYAVTLKNVPITVGFAVITVSQLAFGIYSIVLLGEGGGNVKLSGRRISLIRDCFPTLLRMPLFQPNLSHRYPLMHTTYVCSYRIELDISCLLPSASSTVRSPDYPKSPRS